jgi:hypothetical protein
MLFQVIMLVWVRNYIRRPDAAVEGPFAAWLSPPTLDQGFFISILHFRQPLHKSHRMPGQFGPGVFVKIQAAHHLIAQRRQVPGPFEPSDWKRRRGQTFRAIPSKRVGRSLQKHQVRSLVFLASFSTIRMDLFSSSASDQFERQAQPGRAAAQDGKIVIHRRSTRMNTPDAARASPPCGCARAAG